MTDKALFSVGHVKVYTDMAGHYRIAIEFSPDEANGLACGDALDDDDQRAIFAALDYIDERKVRLA